MMTTDCHTVNQNTLLLWPSLGSVPPLSLVITPPPPKKYSVTFLLVAALRNFFYRGMRRFPFHTLRIPVVNKYFDPGDDISPPSLNTNWKYAENFQTFEVVLFVCSLEKHLAWNLWNANLLWILLWWEPWVYCRWLSPHQLSPLCSKSWQGHFRYSHF